MFRLITPSPAGGLPIGMMITSSEDETTLTGAFSLLKQVLPNDAFYGRGSELGPKVDFAV